MNGYSIGQIEAVEIPHGDVLSARVEANLGAWRFTGFNAFI